MGARRVTFFSVVSLVSWIVTQSSVFHVEYIFIFLTSSLHNSEQETAPNLYPLQMKNRDFEVYMLKSILIFFGAPGLRKCQYPQI